jgi:hypothetical protein
MICLRGCKRVIAQKDAEIAFLREFVSSMRTVNREPTSHSIPVSVDDIIPPAPEPSDQKKNKPTDFGPYADPVLPHDTDEEPR